MQLSQSEIIQIGSGRTVRRIIELETSESPEYGGGGSKQGETILIIEGGSEGKGTGSLYFATQHWGSRLGGHGQFRK